MGVVGGPNYVNDGLVFAADPGNIKSYPGNETEWTDIVGGRVGTLVGGLQNGYNANSKTFTFDGSNDYAVWSATTNGLGLANKPSGTLEFWVKPTRRTSGGTTRFQMIGGLRDTAGDASSELDFFYILLERSTDTDTTNTEARVRGSTNNNTDINVNYFNLYDIWHHSVFTYNNSSGSKLYFNSELVGSNSGTSPGSFGTASSDAKFTVGVLQSTLNFYFLLGEAGSVKVYDRDLSQEEVRQNYHAEKDRYGL